MINVAVIGAGVSGAAAAHAIRSKAKTRGLNPDIDIFEASDRIGGRIRTEQIDGRIVERGAEALAIRDHATQEMLESLGLSLVRPQRLPFALKSPQRGAGSTITPVNPKILKPFPQNVPALWQSPLLSLRGKLSATLRPLFHRTRPSDASLGSLLTSRFGHEATDRLLGPIYGGIYGSPVSELSAKITERPGKSSLTLVTVRSGMESMVDALIAASGAALRLGDSVTSLAQTQNSWSVNGRPYSAVVIAIPAPRAALLLESTLGNVSALLQKVLYTPAVSLLAQVRLDRLPPVTGYLIPGDGELSGVSFVDQKWGRSPTSACTQLIRVFIRPKETPTREVLEELALRELERTLGCRRTAEPILYDYWPAGLPVLSPIFDEQSLEIDNGLQSYPGLAIADGTYRGSGIYDCLRGGDKVGDQIVSYLSQQSEQSLGENKQGDMTYGKRICA